MMQAKLAAAHPEIETWSGVVRPPWHDDRPGRHADGLPRLGTRADGRSAWYVDPAYNKRGTTEHLGYFGRAAGDLRSAVGARAPDSDTGQAAGPRPRRGAGQDGHAPVYRLALISDPTYADYFGTANVLAEKVTLINRVNQIYNDDSPIKMVLVNGTDKLNFDTDAKATGPNGRAARTLLHPRRQRTPTTDYVEGHIPTATSAPWTATRPSSAS